jgi:hypothetical protein
MRTATATTLLALALAFPAAAAPPTEGVLVPGRSLGGLKLGATKAQVLASWGRKHGVCRRCSRTTWYFNYEPFAPAGAGVEFRRGRAVALFTLWSPPGWTTPKGLRLGDPVDRVYELYGTLEETVCGSYSAFRLGGRRTVTAFYVENEKVWGFGLSRPGIPLCR